MRWNFNKSFRRLSIGMSVILLCGSLSLPVRGEEAIGNDMVTDVLAEDVSGGDKDGESSNTDTSQQDISGNENVTGGEENKDSVDSGTDQTSGRNAVVSLVETSTPGTGTIEKDPYGDLYMIDVRYNATEAMSQAVAQYDDLQASLSLTLDNYQCTQGMPQIVLYAMDENYGGWVQNQVDVEEAGKAYNLTLDLSSLKESFGFLGVRIANCDDGTEVGYTIHSLKLTTAQELKEEEETGGLPIVLVGSAEQKRGTVEKNPYGNDYIVDNPLINDRIKAAVLARNDLQLELSVTIDEFTCQGGVPQLVVFAQDAAYTGGSWRQIAEDIIDAGTTYTMELDLSPYTALGGLGSLGFRIVGCDDGTEVVYTINYARVAVKQQEVEEEGVIAVLEKPGTGKIKIAAENAYNPGEHLIKHMFTLPKELSQGGLDGFSSLALKVGVTISEYTSDPSYEYFEEDENGEKQLVGAGAKALIYAMDGTYGNWEQEDIILSEKPQTVELTLDMATYIEQGTLGEFGFEVTGLVDGTRVAYTINYAKVMGEGQANIKETTVDLRYPVKGETKEVAFKDTAVGKGGKLSVAKVDGYKAPTTVDASGKPIQLIGASSHGLSWFPGYVNKEAYQNLRDEWGMNMVRIAVYAREGTYGYVCDDNGEKNADAVSYNDEIIQKGVEAAAELGMYVIIDWHVLNYNPNNDLEEAKAFFAKYATMYKDYDNVLFEICNEPTGTSWYDGSGNDLYTYCCAVSQVIRDCGSDAVIICGTNNYSQEVDEVAAKPLSEAGFQNIMYTCHFYAASHYEEQQQKLLNAINAGIPVMVTEYGLCTASGDGIYDLDNTDKWLDICDENNVSYACWAMSNSQESAAYFKTDCLKHSGWTEEDLTVTSKYLINRYNDRAKELSNTVEVKNGEGTPEIRVNEKEILEAVLTEEERANGNCTVRLEIAGKSAPDADEQKLINNVLGGRKVAGYFDIDVYKTVGGREVQVTDLSKAIRLIFVIPQDMQFDKAVYSVVRVHNNVASVLEDLDKDAKTVTVESSAFSTYALTYILQDEEKGDNSNSQQKPSQTAPAQGTAAHQAASPKTGDDSWNYVGVLMLLGIMCLALGGYQVYRRKENP